ncbi:hypothetical protein K438DRAFT_1749140 [Mycena galopus ATCC 62051]|nr:hypothetical protein K438DRAFT_1749140 [Mycena galopus ATCC 62051]
MTLEYTVVAANALQDIANATGILFVGKLCAVALNIIPMVQGTNFQKEQCLRIVEDIHHLFCILMASIESEDIQSPSVLEQIAQYAVTLQKVESCLRAQRGLGTIKRLFKKSELITQLESCETELKGALRSFKLQQGIGYASALAQFNVDTEIRHQELLELISTQSTASDSISSIGRSLSNTSSGSFSLLPATPQIFHGRESELGDLVNILCGTPARVAILGPGGMGKTTLAVAALHSTIVADKYPTRHFIPCDSAHTKDSLVATIASNLGLDSSSRSAKHVIYHLSEGPPCLVVLDNFETSWEPVEGRTKVEEFLALLADILHVALLITMRGAERPSKVQWTHPFLRPLIALSLDAAHQTFIEIAGETHDNTEVNELLKITDNVPLAIQLVAAVAAFEGCWPTLGHWEVERTNMLSSGYDKCSNLEISIKLSLSSPRMLSSPNALELLSLMSILPDGISDLDLVQSKPPIPDIFKCKTTLIRTSLAYVDHSGKLKVLSPIRNMPPRLETHFGNFHYVLLHGLDMDNTDLGDTIQGIIMLNRLNIVMNRGFSPLMLHLPEILSQIDDHKLHGQFIIGALNSYSVHQMIEPKISIAQGIQHFRMIKDLEGEAELSVRAGDYYLYHVADPKTAQNFYSCALSLGVECNSAMLQGQALTSMAMREFSIGNLLKGMELSHEIYKIGVAAGNILWEANGLKCQAIFHMGLGTFKHGLKLVNKVKAVIVQAGMEGEHSEGTLMMLEALIYEQKSEYAEARDIQEILLQKKPAVLEPVYHAQSCQYKSGISICEVFRADLQLREGDKLGACAEYIRLFASLQSMNGLADPILARSSTRNTLMMHLALMCLGGALAQQCRNDEALSILAVALDGFTWMDVHQRRAESHILWKDARPLFERSSQAKRVAGIDSRLAKLELYHAAKLEQLSKLVVSTTLMEQSLITSENKDDDTKYRKGSEKRLKEFSAT